eukprot:31074-Pelagococcus_subviridis.AAC.26
MHPSCGEYTPPWNFHGPVPHFPSPIVVIVGASPGTIFNTASAWHGSPYSAPVFGSFTARNHLNSPGYSGPTYSTAPSDGSMRNTLRANPGIA